MLQDLDILKILVVGDRVWGRGDTLETALKNAGKPRHYIAYICVPDTRVCDDGSLEFPHGQRPREISRKMPKEMKPKGPRVRKAKV